MSLLWTHVLIFALEHAILCLVGVGLGLGDAKVGDLYLAVVANDDV